MSSGFSFTHTNKIQTIEHIYSSSILQIGNSRYFQVNTLDTAKFMFRYHNNLLPPLFRNLFMTNSQVHRYDTRTASNYRVHSCRTNIKKFTILYQGPRIWNCLPASVTNLSSFSIFKNNVLEFFFKIVTEPQFFEALISYNIVMSRWPPYKPGGFLRSPRLTTCCIL